MSKLKIISVLLSIAICNFSFAEELGSVLRKANWDGIVGTWVDAKTNGVAIKTTFAWKFKDRVIEVTNQDGPKQDVGLIGVNGKSGEVYYMGASNDGALMRGKWDFDKNGDIVFEVAFTSGSGKEGEVKIRYHRVDKDTITMTIELPKPVEIKLIRDKETAN